MKVYRRIVLESVIGMFLSLALMAVRGVNAGVFPLLFCFCLMWWASGKLGWID